MSPGDLQRICEDYPGYGLDFDVLERRMKAGFARSGKLITDDLKALAIKHWVSDIKIRLCSQGFDVRYADNDSNFDVIIISRKSQSKLRRQGY